ncbi:MucR family transcriptional regulator [Sphingopyxis sp.]|uniref:MucR family transcriptional regulator n=1 Tax=Sphingopyxis sp. TaxID=1908224 RepID=UPI0026072DF6|nr:MucR family transcriptional regulator [Sphingopyxis sp.]MCW0198862.1 MucR family transcriptional regulator [Sphingopyxis sp.]
MADVQNDSLLVLTADIVAAHVSNNSVGVADLPDLIARVHGALAGLGAELEPEPELKPAVSIRASVKPDHIVCLEDGKKFKTLKRHLSVDHGLTPEEYRAKWGLGPDYPMTARNYSEQRQAIARKLGLGRKPKAAAKALARRPRAKKAPA